MRPEIFPIGDFHIASTKQSQIFADYLNMRKESCVVLLGDIVHFANSLWNPSVLQLSRAELRLGLAKDLSIWEDFLGRLKVPTIYYFGTHEGLASRVMGKLLSTKLRLENEFVLIPKENHVIKLGSGSGQLYLTGLHIPDNIHPDPKSEEFVHRKAMIERWIERKVGTLDISKPSKTVFCTHDPCDVFYRNLGYRALTLMLKKWPFKVHYHAHIHSNMRNTLIGKTESVNRSFRALSRWNPESLEPIPNEMRSLQTENVTLD